ncbi:hypothetical protein KC332_g15322 [Hortaea werneckii]|uniref:Ketoreductase (KR) domain-containing protein n=1 Tax=Hortaea werneckii EXF-2000 TaxID=1157616 RepID=A0A1Z5TG07_HORWE|nr:hypothetical protein KC350_g15063 [Hortaea werneckii]OTA34937.1 hypothetical protein BTJ68_04598 [Hortaea werneckii EXF-2000]KAI6906807.1 hypothetical protein KC348_g14494 [Hortaea werneckii]KAI6922288.1 hypothetical protein KC341_g15469 [Hortaea werneckii]KAI6956236.1 hypothetical protein KC321_g15285 [Hortaea werneckii]
MSYLSQIFPPTPTFTEKSLDDLCGRVYIITGATSGVGLELAKMLYAANGTVYICGRSQASTDTAISIIRDSASKTTTQGRLNPLIFDLADLSTVRSAAQLFLRQEQRLDVLFLNAGIMTPPPGSQTTNGHDLELGSHCLASFLLCKLLQPVLEATASWHRLSCTAEGCAELKDHLKGRSNSVASTDSGVRIVWVSSFISQAPKGGVQFDERTGTPRLLKGMENYLQSKAGEVLLAEEWNRRYEGEGVLNVGVNPGLLRTGLQRHMPAAQRAVMHQIFKPARFGAYSELYAGFSPDVQPGDFIIPFGRRTKLPTHIAKSLETDTRGQSTATRFWKWCEDQIRECL